MEIVPDIILFVQDLVFLVPFGESKFHGKPVIFFNLKHTKSKGNTSSIRMCDTREREVLLQGDEKTFSGQRCEKLIPQGQKEIRQMLHKTDQLSFLTSPQRTSTNERQAKQLLSCWPFLSFKSSSNWVPSFEVSQMMSLLKLLCPCLHAGMSTKRELGMQYSEVEAAGKL